MINLKNEKQKLSLSGASSEPIISAESLYCHARPRSGISAESKRDSRLIATQSPRITEKAMSFLRLRGASGAQGISTPASCHKAHKRRFILNSRILRFTNAPLRMTIPTLALLLSLNISESRADCGTAVTGDGAVGTNAAGNKCGVCGTAGHESDCLWEIKDGVLTISKASGVDGNASMADYSYKAITADTANGYTSEYSSNAPWQRQDVTSVVVENGISNIGEYAFIGDTKITSVTGMENVTSIGKLAFYYAQSFENITMPNVEEIGKWAFGYADSLQSVDMPNVRIIRELAFGYADSLQSLDIPNSTEIGIGAFDTTPTLTDVNCIGTETQCNLLKLFMKENGSAKLAEGALHPITPIANCSGYSQGACSSCKSGYTLSNSTCVATSNQLDDDLLDDYSDLEGCPEGKIAKGDSCIPAAQGCGENWRQIETWCNRIRYTPAEAAEVLKDDNTNSVTITFRK